MKALLLAVLLFSSAQCARSKMVYVCDSSNAYRYHLKANCIGLRNCSRRIIAISLEQARRENKSLCKWER